MRRWKRARIAVWMAVSVLTFGLTVQASTGSIQRKGGLQEQQSEAGKEAVYAEGQAIILYETGSSTKSAMNSTDLGGNMVIEETYVFEMEEDTEAAKSPNSAKTVGTGNLWVSLVTSDTYTTEQLVKLLNARSDIRIAEPNYKYHILDTDYTGFQWALKNTGQNAGTAGVDVSPEKIKEKATTDDKEKVIALVDTGIDYTHPDLQNAVWKNPYLSQLKGEYGYDIVNKDADPMDDNGHGSHCAGIMAASADGSGISGIAQDSHVKIMALKILDADGFCYGMEAVGAYNYIYRAQQLGVNVVAVNNSWGGYSEEGEVKIFSELVDLVGEAGALSVCAAGNESLDADQSSAEEIYPANIDSPYIVSVAAVNEKGELASFSNYGAEKVDIAAPGTDILSTVSYDTFNPGIYSEQMRNELCGTYIDFESVEEETLTETFSYVMELEGNATATAALTSDEYFGISPGKSLAWTIQDAKADGSYLLAIPYETTEKSVYISAMARLTDNDNPVDKDSISYTLYGDSMVSVCDGIIKKNGDNNWVIDTDSSNLIGQTSADNCWGHITGKSANKPTGEERRAIIIQLMAASDGQYTIYLDNIGVSRGNDNPEKFGKYDYYNGTSMAAPYVTGAVAAIAQAYPEQSAIERKSVVLSCSEKKLELADKVSSGGMLDFERLSNPRMSITGIALNEDKNIEITGNYLKENVTVKFNGETVTPMNQTDTCITINGSDFLNKRLRITIQKDDDIYEDSCYFSDGKVMTTGKTIYGVLSEGEMVSDGETIYQIDSGGAIYAMNQTENEDGTEGQFVWSWMSEGYNVRLFGKEFGTYVDYSLYSETGAVCLNGRIYTVLTLDAGFTKNSILVCADNENGWMKAADLPSDFADYTGMMIGAYKGELYLMGGWNETDKTFGKKVYSYNPDQKTWIKRTELPQGRAFSKAVQVQDKLVVTLGCCDMIETYPVNMIYTGNSWTVTKAPLNMTANASYHYGENELLNYYTAHIGVMKNGIIYEGNTADGLGSIYTYQLGKDSYQTTGYMLDTKLTQGKNSNGTSFRDKFYVMVSGVDTEGIEVTNTYTLPIASACIQAKCTATEGGFIENADKYWLPGDRMTFTAEAMDDYYVESFTAAGKKVGADSKKQYVFTGLACDYPNGLNIALTVKPYVTEIFMEEMLDIPVGDTYMLMPYVMPDTLENVKLKWESDNGSVIAVNQEGVVTVSRKAKVGDTATIKVTALDRETISAVCRVTVCDTVQKVPAKNKKVKVGKLTYKVTKSAASGGTVSCIAMNNKNLTRITIPDTVKVNGYKFKVTKIENNAFKSAKKLKSITIGKNVSTIGKNVCKSCKRLKKITIKSSKIKSIGKGSFTSIHKKATITVPKKKKSSYQKKLKKAGCNGTVKGK